MSTYVSAAFGVGALAAMALAPLTRALDLEAGTPLRVCAAPNDLPFSNDRRLGFENRVADLVAHDLGRPVQYVWSVPGRRFARDMLQSGGCDVVMGVAEDAPGYARSRPYYWSAFVLVSPRARALKVYDLADRRFDSVTVVLHASDDDGASVPGVKAAMGGQLARRARKFLVHGDADGSNRMARVLDSVVEGHADAAIAWGPLAAYFARQHPVPMTITPIVVGAEGDAAAPPYPVSIGVRRSAPGLLANIDQALERRAKDIERLLSSYEVPMLQWNPPPRSLSGTSSPSGIRLADRR